jgi:hypothetical protein
MRTYDSTQTLDNTVYPVTSWVFFTVGTVYCVLYVYTYVRYCTQTKHGKIHKNMFL